MNESLIKFKSLPIEGYTHYFVSNYGGLVWNNDTKKFLKTPENNVGYKQICLHSSIDKKPKVLSVARAVALCWVDGYGSYDASNNQYRYEVSHINEDARFISSNSKSNDASNLCWASRKENLRMPLYIERQRKAMTERWQDASFHESQRRKIREGLIRHYSNSEPLF